MFMLSVSLARMSMTIFKDIDDERHLYFALCFKGKASDTFLVVPQQVWDPLLLSTGAVMIANHNKKPWASGTKHEGAHCLERFAFSRILNLPQILSLQGWSSSQSLTESSSGIHSSPEDFVLSSANPILLICARNKVLTLTAARLGSPRSIALDQTKQ